MCSKSVEFIYQNKDRIGTIIRLKFMKDKTSKRTGFLLLLLLFKNLNKAKETLPCSEIYSTKLP